MSRLSYFREILALSSPSNSIILSTRFNNLSWNPRYGSILEKICHPIY